MYRVWYHDIGDDTPSIITSEDAFRPIEAGFITDDGTHVQSGELRPDFYSLTWDGDTPSVSKRPDSELDPIRLEARKTAMQSEMKATCQSKIYGKYTVETQLNAHSGIYGETYLTGMVSEIVAMIAEEDRLYDAIENAEDNDDLDLIIPTWPI